MEGKKYSLGDFTFDTEQEYERAKAELQVILKIKQRYDINNPEDAGKILEAVNKKGDVFKSSVGRAFINKLKRISGTEQKQKSTADTNQEQKSISGIEQKRKRVSATNQELKKVSISRQEEAHQDRVVIPIIAEGRKNADIKYHIIFFMTFLFAAVAPYFTDGTDGVGAASAFVFLLVIGIASIRSIKKNKKNADEYIYNHLSDGEKEEFESKRIKDKEFADNATFIVKILMFILMIACPPLLVAFIVFMLLVKSSSKIKWLIHNWKSGMMNAVYYVALFMVEAVPLIADVYYDIKLPVIIAIIPAILISVIMYSMIMTTHKSQFYLAMRNIAMYPIVILLTLLPFALTGAMAYIGYSAKNAVNNINGGGGNPYGGTGPDFVYDNPPVYQVSGYSYYNSHGTFVVVGPSMRTMPDASIYNNLSYKG